MKKRIMQYLKYTRPIWIPASAYTGKEWMLTMLMLKRSSLTMTHCTISKLLIQNWGNEQPYSRVHSPCGDEKTD